MTGSGFKLDAATESVLQQRVGQIAAAESPARLARMAAAAAEEEPRSRCGNGYQTADRDTRDWWRGRHCGCRCSPSLCRRGRCCWRCRGGWRGGRWRSSGWRRSSRDGRGGRWRNSCRGRRCRARTRGWPLRARRRVRWERTGEVICWARRVLQVAPAGVVLERQARRHDAGESVLVQGQHRHRCQPRNGVWDGSVNCVVVQGYRIKLSAQRGPIFGQGAGNVVVGHVPVFGCRHRRACSETLHLQPLSMA